MIDQRFQISSIAVQPVPVGACETAVDSKMQRRLGPTWRFAGLLLMFGALTVSAQHNLSPEALAMRSDTGLALESLIASAPDEAQAEIERVLHAGEGARPGRMRGLLFLLSGKLALNQNQEAAAQQALDAAEVLLKSHGSPRDRSRLCLQQLHLPARAQDTGTAFAARLPGAMACAQAAGDDWALANMYLLDGYVAAQHSAFQRALAATEQGYAIARKLPDQRLSALLLNNLANARKNLGMLGGALDAHFQALALRREFGDESSIIQSLSNIVLVYQQMEDLGEARRYSEEALQRSQRASTPQERTRIALNHAALLVELGAIADAEAALNVLNAVRADVTARYPQWRYSLLSSEAKAFNALRRPGEALVSAEAAVSAARQSSTSELVEVLRTLATVQIAQSPPQLQAAAQTLREAIVLAERVQLVSIESTLHQQLANVLENQGDLAGALREWRLHQALSKRVHGLEQVRRIAALEQQVANADRERELAEMRTRDLVQQAQISRQRWLGGMGIVTLLAIALALYSRFRYAQKRAHAMELAREALTQQNLLLEKMANTDALTGLRNRQWMHKELEARAAAEPPGASVAILDIDHFKAINDQYGHDVGDAVLIGIARLLQGQLQPDAASARWGGEEFIILLRDDLSASFEILDRLRQALAELRDWPVTMTVTCSIGVAGKLPGEASLAWLKRADQALYSAKRGGRNQVVAASA